MPETTIQILSTRPVPEEWVEKASAAGIGLDIIPFIDTHAITDYTVQQEVEWAATEEAVVVFTSMNAVEAVTGLLEEQVPDWQIYCMGNTTEQLVKKYFGEASIAGTARDASELAELIIETGDCEELIFFCGNIRRDELPQKLRKAGIGVSEIIVYETEALHHRLQKKYDAVLFFSPSAVESFFHDNKPSEKTVLFAIGNTTKQCIEKYCRNTVIVGNMPGKENLVEKAINWAMRRV